MQDLKDFTQDVHYENFRKKKLLEGSPAASYGMAPGMAPGMPPVDVSPAGGNAADIMRLKEQQVGHMTYHNHKFNDGIHIQ